MKKSDIYVHDIETIINCFVVSFVNVDNPSLKFSFKISPFHNDLDFIYHFLDSCKGIVGFNSLSFDSPILQYIYDNFNRLEKMTPRAIVYEIYEIAQQIITEEKRNKRHGLDILHVDLFKMHHFDNKAKATSLKWIECHLGMDNIQEMPIAHGDIIKTIEQVDMVVDYNINDCEATRRLLLHPKSVDLINMRRWAIKEYGDERMRNLSNASLGERIFQLSLEKGGAEIAPPSRARSFFFKEIIFPEIKFQTPLFSKVLVYFQRFEIDVTSEDAPSGKYSVTYDGLQYDFGLGGLHAARKNEFFTEVTSVDATSYYPRIAIVNEMHPRHIDQEIFTRTYGKAFDTRMLHPKGSTQNEAWKEVLNCVFGKSFSEYSFLYDPQFGYGITINGQLLLAMLCERITETRAGQVIMVNTDGIEVKVFDKKAFDEALVWWCDFTRMTVKEEKYKYLLIRDANNYIGEKEGGKVKANGAYESQKEFHQDPSMLVVPKVVAQLFRIDIPERTHIVEILKTYARTVGINDFFLFARAKTGEFIAKHPSARYTLSLPRTVRYIITNQGYIFCRKTDKKADKIHKNALCTFMNDLREAEPPRNELIEMIDYEWYANEVLKLLNSKLVAEPTLFS